ncbi:2-polyprenyl-3-methyl-6-methoxy-1,4-benzoquinone monooxygenase [Eoetvoesiella caeni]
MREHLHTSQQPGFARRQSRLDALLGEVGTALTVLSGAAHAGRPNPGGKAGPGPQAMPAAEQKHSAGLMRVNHVGEICAQALYRGQAVLCRDEKARQVFRDAAAEEVDHLVWCNQRLRELQSRPSYLNPLWYGGSFTLGLLAGLGGTSRNLGFMAETEAQVERHLESHLKDLPAGDERSRRIVEQMRDDEARHRDTAQASGGQVLPRPVKFAMRCMSKVMTTTAYRI